MPHEQGVLDRIDTMTDEIVAFVQDLTRIPTVNPPGESYADCAQAIGAKLREFGYQVALLEAEGRPEHTPQHPRVNVLGELAGSAARPVLHFNGHFDVVPAGDGWTVDPFSATLR